MPHGSVAMSENGNSVLTENKVLLSEPKTTQTPLKFVKQFLRYPVDQYTDQWDQKQNLLGRGDI